MTENYWCFELNINYFMISKYATRNAPEYDNVILIYRCNYQLI